jgi:CspA family cold shock protein
MAELLRGSVKWFNDAKGFGFIEHTTGKDVFVHYSVIEWDGFKTLKDGEEVEYELKEGQKGLHAARVMRPQAEAKKIEKETLSGSEQIAPNLQSGAVKTTYKSSSDMIKVESTEDMLARENISSLGSESSNLETTKSR